MGGPRAAPSQRRAPRGGRAGIRAGRRRRIGRRRLDRCERRRVFCGDRRSVVLVFRCPGDPGRPIVRPFACRRGWWPSDLGMFVVAAGGRDGDRWRSGGPADEHPVPALPAGRLVHFLRQLGLGNLVGCATVVADDSHGAPSVGWFGLVQGRERRVVVHGSRSVNGVPVACRMQGNRQRVRPRGRTARPHETQPGADPGRPRVGNELSAAWRGTRGRRQGIGSRLRASAPPLGQASRSPPSSPPDAPGTHENGRSAQCPWRRLRPAGRGRSGRERSGPASVLAVALRSLRAESPPGPPAGPALRTRSHRAVGTRRRAMRVERAGVHHPARRWRRRRALQVDERRCSPRRPAGGWPLRPRDTTV